MASKRSRAAGTYAVRSEITKQLGVVAIVAALGVWQHHFVYQAASADVYLFALLFTAGLYGIYNAISGTHRLANEFTALEAMKEVYEDALWIKRAGEEAVEAQFLRVSRPATVYQVPHVLATAHNLIVEEVQRNGSFRIPTGTMQVLVADIETKLDDRQAMSHYLGALMVLLGLLGTFIGLMHTLESVGGILGSLDLSGNGGAGAIASLIESLKRPLEGMSTGFGASLFGLIGSLIIGFLSKVDAKAADRLKHEFETWIRSAVQIEGAYSREIGGMGAVGGGGGNAGSGSGSLESGGVETNPRTMLRVARSTVLATARLTEQMETLVTAINKTHREIGEQRSVLVRIATSAEESHTIHAATEKHVMTLNAETSASQAVLHDLNERLKNLFDAQRHMNVSLTDGQRWEGQMLRQTIQDAVEGIREVKRVGASLESCIVSLSRPAESEAAVPAKMPTEIAEIVADLDHLISMSRLQPQDVFNLKRLSTFLADPNGAETGAEMPPAIKSAAEKLAS